MQFNELSLCQKLSCMRIVCEMAQKRKIAIFADQDWMDFVNTLKKVQSDRRSCFILAMHTLLNDKSFTPDKNFLDALQELHSKHEKIFRMLDQIFYYEKKPIGIDIIIRDAILSRIFRYRTYNLKQMQEHFYFNGREDLGITRAQFAADAKKLLSCGTQEEKEQWDAWWRNWEENGLYDKKNNKLAPAVKNSHGLFEFMGWELPGEELSDVGACGGLVQNQL